MKFCRASDMPPFFMQRHSVAQQWRPVAPA
jgi:hypothetical protein